jgi:glycosyltransferase involved in cell wall biosynthesis
MARPLRILELRSVRGTGGGPEKTILMGAAHSDPRRFAVTVCYLRDARDKMFVVDARAAALPIDYVEIYERHSFDPAIWPALRRLIRTRQIDIVHAHDYKTNFLAWLLARRHGVSVLSTAHGWNAHTRRELVYYAADKRILARFTRTIAVSRLIAAELIRCGASPERVSVILNGIDHQAFRRDRAREADERARLGLAAGDRVVGVVGRLEIEKRFDLVLEAIAGLRAAHPSIKLVVAGEGSLRPALEQQAARLGLQSACRFLGYTTDVIGMHHALDVFVQASDTEGTPNGVLEAMSLETPVVATGVGGTPDIVRDGVDGLIVPRGRPQALTDAIHAVLADPDAAARRAVSARSRIERELSFDARMAAVESIYEDLARPRPGVAAPAGVPA